MKLLLWLTAGIFIFYPCRITFAKNPLKAYDVISQDSTVKSSDSIVINEERVFTWYQAITNLPSDYVNFFSNTFSQRNTYPLISIAVLTGGLMAVDQNGWRFEHNLINRSPVDRKTSDLLVQLGDGRYQFISAALFSVSGIIFQNQTAVRTGSNIAEAVLSTGILVQVLKRISGRESPAAATVKGGDWDPFPSIKQYQKNQPSYYSFPSGHLATTTAILTVIANNYPEQKWIKPLGYPVLGLLGYSLVSKGMHWYSDLPLAFFIGYSMGNVIAPERKSDYSDAGLNIFPSISLRDVHINFLFSL